MVKSSIGPFESLTFLQGEPLNVQNHLKNWQFEKYHYKVLFRSIFWNWYAKKSCRFWFVDSISMVGFTNAITKFFYIFWKRNSKILSKFDYKQNIILFWVKFVGMDLKWGSLHIVIFWNFCVLKIYDLILKNPILK